MKHVDYSQAIAQSAQDKCWKTAQDVDPSDFPRITRRLRYQAHSLGMEVSIQTDRQNRTVSFLARKLNL